MRRLCYSHRALWDHALAVTDACLQQEAGDVGVRVAHRHVQRRDAELRHAWECLTPRHV
jgi:hypothetical protein